MGSSPLFPTDYTHAYPHYVHPSLRSARVPGVHQRGHVTSNDHNNTDVVSVYMQTSKNCYRHGFVWEYCARTRMWLDIFEQGDVDRTAIRRFMYHLAGDSSVKS